MLVLEQALVNRAVNERIREFLQSALHLIYLEPKSLARDGLVFRPFFFQFFQASPCQCYLVLGKINISQPAEHRFIKLFFADRCRRTVRRILEGAVMTTIVDMAFLPFRDERVITASAADDPAVREHVIRGSVDALAGKHRLSRFEHVRRGERLVASLKCLSSLLDRHQADIKPVSENRSEGTLHPRDLPEVWNEKMKTYLGVTVPNDAIGVLQDVHWSGGSFGYFPTYTLGNLYSAQFFRAAKRDIPNLEEEIARGEYGHLLAWLRKNVHIHGRKYFQDELAMRATGEKLTARYFTEYLGKKFGEIYGLG